MAKWISTAYYQVLYDLQTVPQDNVKSLLGKNLAAMRVDKRQLTEQLDDLILCLEQSQGEIKAVIPLHESIFSSKEVVRDSEMAVGEESFETDISVGFIVLAQATETISEVEYTRREQIVKTKQYIRDVSKEYAALTTKIAEMNTEKIVTPVKRGIFKSIYIIEGEEFQDKEAAEAYAAELIRRDKETCAKLLRLEERLHHAKEQLIRLEERGEGA